MENALFVGYDKCNSVLDFHHLDPTKKEFTIGYIKSTTFNEIVKKELDKCILVCRNCHAEIHDKEHCDKYPNIIPLTREERIKVKNYCVQCNKEISSFWKKCYECQGRNIRDKITLTKISKCKKKTSVFTKKYSYCPNCNAIKNKKSDKCKKCYTKYLSSLKGIPTNRTKIQWPPIDILLEMLSKSNYTQLGKQLGVSDNAIRKHIESKRPAQDSNPEP